MWIKFTSCQAAALYVPPYATVSGIGYFQPALWKWLEASLPDGRPHEQV